ncbi:cobyrinic acid A,C-diamide synthase [Dinoroseobacter shibae DFL 12 = DSM 16493]|uniref:Hydrogenobyrinate a,c-diamide synthase n=1 Tax=Dinoroseobacter shibae (strain DSM 16493 / NCIMB 14021 / DFL 12) TaxID=398580 RepID=A8LLQ7_DINSH|nr:cobyrinate a,c-diamide synthase [Dinoroseobacter shibae]ABV93435.1 cobyrinic acid A,C-diamide synthase [Dinoroseobacter shibae DFL 12 = DSM 16493]URF48349.1 cobyrinate a,c-diamide synthase [Dinoroseobacter shibae]URF52659.1 cobyrinate a,c-diamide synthase [Dinoroseobacter shibae]
MSAPRGRGLLLAAPASGAGKTTVTLGILAALTARGLAVRGAKSGPDYIDPQFHAAATGQDCLNLDPWAMTPDMLRHLASGPDLLIVEGAMGLFDGAADGSGASADLARHLGLPVVLIVDAARMAQSIAPLVAGFAHHDPDVTVAGVILNRVGSPRHTDMLRTALAPLGIPVLGAVPRRADLATPSRHLGLVQATERADLDAFLARAGAQIGATVDLDALTACARPLPDGPTVPTALPPPGQRIAVARDAAFGFAYPHMLQAWRAAGAEVLPFAPLADDPAPEDADAIFLPGGYPELHAGKLAAATVFLDSLRRAAGRDTLIYGECGGYMVLGDGLVDADGIRHRMAGLLTLETSFAHRKLHLGYRTLRPLGGPFSGPFRGHEFHYAATLRAEGPPLFAAADATGVPLGETGLRRGSVCGSFAHIVAPDSAP